MRVSIIISTYEQPALLANTLLGFAAQQTADFEIIIADDGSGPATRDVVDGFAQRSPIRVEHCWHPDDGFRKTVILNRAITRSNADYLIFTDGDCIPRRDFVASHVAAARPGRFLSGGVEYLSEPASRAITPDAIRDQSLFDPANLARGRERPRPVGKVNRNALVQRLARRLSWTRPTFNGHNASAFKSDIVAVNGFDERMVYGGLDRELGECLTNAGIVGVSVRYDAIMVHQYHDRPYDTPRGWAANQQIRAEIRRRRLSWTDWGIVRPVGGQS